MITNPDPNPNHNPNPNPNPNPNEGRLFCALLMPFAVFSLSMFMSSLHNMQEADKMGADKTLRERLGDLKEVTYSPLSHGTSHCQ